MVRVYSMMITHGWLWEEEGLYVGKRRKLNAEDEKEKESMANDDGRIRI